MKVALSGLNILYVYDIQMNFQVLQVNMEPAESGTQDDVYICFNPNPGRPWFPYVLM
jgi:hypothetical protein